MIFVIILLVINKWISELVILMKSLPTPMYVQNEPIRYQSLLLITHNEATTMTQGKDLYLLDEIYRDDRQSHILLVLFYFSYSVKEEENADGRLFDGQKLPSRSAWYQVCDITDPDFDCILRTTNYQHSTPPTVSKKKSNKRNNYSVISIIDLSFFTYRNKTAIFIQQHL